MRCKGAGGTVIFSEARTMTVPAKSSRLESYAKTEGFEAASGIENTFESPGFRYPSIHAKGAAASHLAGTIHAPSSLNGSSHSSMSFEWFWCRMSGLEGLLL